MPHVKLIGALAFLALTGLVFWIGSYFSLPAVIHDRWLEFAVRQQVRQGDTKSQVAAILKHSGVEWHAGHAYPDPGCSADATKPACLGDVLEARFLRFATVCVENSEILVYEFKHGHVYGTRTFDSGDGC